MKQLCMGAGIVLATLVLAGCGEKKTVEVKNASPGDVAAQVANADIHLIPGAWETEIRTADFQIEGMPPEAAARMKQAMAQSKGAASTVRTCVTPEKAAHPDRDFFKGNKDCKYKDFTLGGGKLSGTMECNGERGSATTMTVNGTYTPDSYAMDMTMKGNDDGRAISMHMVATSHHVGDCKPGDAKD